MVAGDAKASAVDVRDVAEVAVVALTLAGHEGKIYDLIPISFSDATLRPPQPPL